MYMYNVRKLTLTNSPIYADVIAPTRPAILDTPSGLGLMSVSLLHCSQTFPCGYLYQAVICI
jgi:hypothetical protein